MSNTLDESFGRARTRSTGLVARAASQPSAVNSRRRVGATMPGLVGADELLAPPLGQSAIHARQQQQHLRGWVYTFCKPIANRIASQGVRVARVVKATPKKQKPGKREAFVKAALPKCLKQYEGPNGAEVLPSHDFLDAIQRPNEVMTLWALLYVTVISLQITGRGFWWVKARTPTPEDDRKWEIWHVPSGWMTPIHTDDKLFDSWRCLPPHGDETVISGSEVVYFHYPDFTDPLGSFAPMQAADKAVATDECIQEAQRRGFANGINPGWILKVGRLPDVATGGPGQRPVLTDVQRAQLIHAIKRVYGGVTRFNEPLIIDGLIDDAIRGTNTNIEMAYGESGKITKDRISQIFGVSPVITGQMENSNRACHDSETELLTKRGWLDYADIREDDVAGTMNPDTGKFEWQAISKIHLYPDYDGEMVRLKGSKIDALVTPDHRMWTKRGYQMGNPKTHGQPWEFKPASELRCHDMLLLSPKSHEAEGRESFFISGLPFSPGGRKNSSTPDWTVPAGMFLEFVGWWVSEGWTVSHKLKRTGKNCHTIGIKQAAGAVSENDMIYRCMKGIGVGRVQKLHAKGKIASETADGYARQASHTYTITDKGLWSWLREHGGVGSHNKKLPEMVFDLSGEQLEPMLEAMLLGDGCHISKSDKGSLATYFSVSKKLADQTQSVSKKLADQTQTVAMMCGRASRILKRMKQGVYPVAVSSCSTEMWLLPKHISREQYKGAVWCVTVPNGLVITRRNGKPLVSGNSSLVADENFTQNTVNPLLEMISEVLTSFLGPKFAKKGERLLLYIEPATTTDAELDLKQLLALYDRGGCDINYLRAKLQGLPPIPGGNVAFVRPELVPTVIEAEDGDGVNPFVQQFNARPKLPSPSKPGNDNLVNKPEEGDPSAP